MINVLINAYAVAPNRGSEPGMGWNWVINIAKYCNVYVITEGEWKDEIELELEQLPQKDNIHFYYCPVSDKIRKMCWNQGDWRFYYFYRQWQKKALLLAKSIIATNRIDLIHQLNMTGFREPGLLWRIDSIPFVWGPMGGMELIPWNYLYREPLKLQVSITLKNIINLLQRRFQPNVLKALKTADIVYAATLGTKDYIKNHFLKNVTLLNETGCYEQEIILNNQHRGEFNIIWVGKFDFRKQLGLALEIVSCLKDIPDIRFHIIGTGSPLDVEKYHNMANELNLSNVVWHGQLPHNEVQTIMRECDILLFTSIMEGTPHVVLESIQNALPVICFDTCGQGNVVDDSIGVKIPLHNKSLAKNLFVSSIRDLYQNREMLINKSNNCVERQKELYWEMKARTVFESYCTII